MAINAAKTLASFLSTAVPAEITPQCDAIISHMAGVPRAPITTEAPISGGMTQQKLDRVLMSTSGIVADPFGTPEEMEAKLAQMKAETANKAVAACDQAQGREVIKTNMLYGTSFEGMMQTLRGRIG